ncbi:MAG: YciI family protein [Undibacterium sp.]|nr:YciI family protein [Undibacterium sp.]
MLFAVRFTDKTGLGAVRQQHMSAHIAWLDERQATIKVAGSLRQTPDDLPLGALWIVEAESTAAVEALYQTDPFWTHGLRQSVEILHWSKAFPDIQVSV